MRPLPSETGWLSNHTMSVVNCPHDGASVLACAYQLKVRSQNPKNFEHWFSQRLWVKFAMFLLSSTSVDAGAIIGETLLLLANQDSAH